ncbi:MAG: hypothetical protein ABIV28_03155, partial [Longimicrobiales bacterium]
MSDPRIDPERIRTVPFAERASIVNENAAATAPGADRSFHAFLDSLPDSLQARSFIAVADAIANASRGGHAVVCMIGGHVIKTGLAPILIDLMRRGVITHIAGNGAVAIHDYELARWGATSEDVESGLADGTFGMAEETGREMNELLRQGAAQGLGMGEALGVGLEGKGAEGSLLYQCARLGVRFSVHAAIGAEIIHQHPHADGAAIGATSMTDFHALAAHLPRLENGVVLNIGSAVIMPEVFLKALTICRNVNSGAPRVFTAADF